MANRLLPEWAPQDAVQLTWPAPDSDWAPLLERIEASLERLVAAIVRYQSVVIAAPDTHARNRLAERFARLGIPLDRLHLVIAEADDTWARDHGPWPSSRMARRCCWTTCSPAGVASSRPPATTA
ncbi:agmatine deiminase [Halomonas elongata]|uniref:Agmatine deiminase n=1 Tax=Halomonas elongata TaxID=2746 RepID=A0A1B8P4S9_HALEL|nr:agmatine deiminase [Halomonas elongata]